jgi:hypothetical protein
MAAGKSAGSNEARVRAVVGEWQEVRWEAGWARGWCESSWACMCPAYHSARGSRTSPNARHDTAISQSMAHLLADMRRTSSCVAGAALCSTGHQARVAQPVHQSGPCQAPGGDALALSVSPCIINDQQHASMTVCATCCIGNSLPGSTLMYGIQVDPAMGHA